MSYMADRKATSCISVAHRSKDNVSCSMLVSCLLCSFCWYSSNLPTEGWPSWVDLASWLYTMTAYLPRDSRILVKSIYSHHMSSTVALAYQDTLHSDVHEMCAFQIWQKYINNIKASIDKRTLKKTWSQSLSMHVDNVIYHHKVDLNLQNLFGIQSCNL